MVKNNKKNVALVDTKMGGVSLAALAMIPDCRGDKCKIHSMCPYVKYGQCGFRRKNIIRTISIYMKAFPDGDEFIGQKIGKFLIPAWDHYLWSMIESQALDSMTVGNAETGVIKAHPIFAMQERFMKQILALENQYDLEHVRVESGDSGDDDLGDENKLIEGDPEYYDMMAGGVEHSGQDKFDPEDI